MQYIILKFLIQFNIYQTKSMIFKSFYYIRVNQIRIA